MEQLLISLVKEHPAIYDRSDVNYKHRVGVVDKVWSFIAEKMRDAGFCSFESRVWKRQRKIGGSTGLYLSQSCAVTTLMTMETIFAGADAAKKWEKLRNCYRNARRRYDEGVKYGRIDAGSTPTWEHWESIQWLDPHLNTSLVFPNFTFPKKASPPATMATNSESNVSTKNVKIVPFSDNLDSLDLKRKSVVSTNDPDTGRLPCKEESLTPVSESTVLTNDLDFDPLPRKRARIPEQLPAVAPPLPQISNMLLPFPKTNFVSNYFECPHDEDEINAIRFASMVKEQYRLLTREQRKLFHAKVQKSYLEVLEYQA